MLRAVYLILFCFFIIVFSASGQSQKMPELDSLNRAIIELDQEVYQIQLNLHQAQNQLKTGIFVATVGYTITIIGGQLLGSNPDLGKGLLYAGGATGIAGTFVLVKGFNKISLGRPSLRRQF